MGLSYMACIMLRYVTLASILWSIMVSVFWILPDAFSASTELSTWLLSFILLMCCIMIDLQMLSHPWIPGVNPLDCGVWLFLCIVESGVLVFCWVLHLCSSGMLACSFLVAYLSHFGIRIVLASQNEFDASLQVFGRVWEGLILFFKCLVEFTSAVVLDFWWEIFDYLFY